MKIFSLYRDFFKFQEKMTSPSKQFKAYLTYYFKPHRKFLESYFSHFPLLNFSNLKQRVEAIRKSDYARLKNIISICPPEKIIREAYRTSKRVVYPGKEPEVYLFIGFFSPEGFVMDFEGRHVICFGLERFKDFALLKILFAHEYAHFLLNLGRGEVGEEEKSKWLLISEGVATFFSHLAFPTHPLPDHFLFRRDMLNWCQANESYLREVYCSGTFSPRELIDLYARGNAELDIPPRAGKYLGWQAVKKYLTQSRTKTIDSLLSDKKSALSLEL